MASLDPLPPLLQATSGAIGSAVGNAIVFPLDLATTRLQHAPAGSARKASLLQTLRRLTQHRDLSHLYSGLGADTLSTLLSSFLYFYFYTSLTKVVQSPSYPLRTLASTSNSTSTASRATTKSASDLGHGNPKRPLSAIEELLVGLIAGVASKGITLPVSAVKVRQQLASEVDNRNGGDGHHDQYGGKGTGLLETIKAMHREGGFLGLFAALPPSIPLALLPSLTLYIHTFLLKLLLPARLRTHPPGYVTFLLGALSNALATIPLYPLVLIKALSQSGVGIRQGKDKGKGKQGEGMIGTMQGVVKREGVQGLYKGIEGQLLKGFVSQGVMMLIKQRVEEAVVKAYRARKASS